MQLAVAEKRHLPPQLTSDPHQPPHLPGHRRLASSLLELKAEELRRTAENTGGAGLKEVWRGGREGPVVEEGPGGVVLYDQLTVPLLLKCPKV